MKVTLSHFFSVPARLMSRLSFTRRWIALVVIILLAFSIISGILFNRFTSSILTLESELHGLSLLPPVFTIVQHAQKHRGYSAGVLGGAKELVEPQLATFQQTKKAFEYAEKILPSSLTSKESWLDIRKSWEELRQHGMDWSQNENFTKHTLLIKKLWYFALLVADEFELSNQADLGTHYLLSTVLQQLIPALEFLGQTRAMGTGIISKAWSTEQERSEVHSLLSKTEYVIQVLLHKVGKTAQFNPDIGKELNEISRTIGSEVSDIHKIIIAQVIKGDHSVTPKEFFDILSEVIDNNNAMIKSLIFPLVKSLIQRRIENQYQMFTTVVIWLLIIYFVIIYFSAGMYLSTIENISAMSDTTLAFAAGDYDRRISTESHSEYAVLSNSFNHMADQIKHHIKSEEQGRERIQAIIDSSIDAQVQMNEQGMVTGWSHQAETVFGWSAEEAINQPLHKLIIPLRYHEAHLSGLHHFLKTGEGPILGQVVDIEARHRNGTEIPIELVISNTRIGQGYEFNAFIRDITERKKGEESFRLFGQIFEHSFEGITITDEKANIIEVNPAFSLITGYSQQEVVGKNPSMLSSGKQSQEFYKSMWSELSEFGNWQGELWNRKKNGDIYAIQLTMSRVNDDEGNLKHYIGLFSDITVSKRQQDELKIMAHYDLLTRLPNRVLLSDRFNQSVAHARRTKTMLGVCFLDLDKFKPINDSFGHKVGDQLLIDVARRIESVTRGEDTVSRLGGDEFALILTNINHKSECEKLLGRIIRECSRPFSIESHQLQISVSIGIAIADPISADLDTLLREADNAMYSVKRTGRDGYQFFNSADDQRFIDMQARLVELRRALDNEEFCLHYQPKINMLNGEVTGVEALIRWQHPEKGLLSPGAFLPLVKGTELEISIGIWVMNEVARQISEWEERGWQVEVSINVSPSHLQSSGFCANLGSAINSHNIKADSCMQLEILESSELGDIDNICDVIKTCQETLGVRIALDDFGTGYSALTHIRNLSADVVKIDQSFVRGLLDNPGDLEIIKGVISLCEAFDCGVIAEGVETIEQGQILLLLGCHHAQGYCIARPQAAEEMFCWIQDYQPNTHWQKFSRLELASEEKEQFFLETVLACNLEIIKEQFQTSNSTRQLNYSDYYQQSHYLPWKQRNKNKLLFTTKWLNELDIRYGAVCDNLVNLEKVADSRQCTNEDLSQAIEHAEQAFDLMRAHLKAPTYGNQFEQTIFNV